MNYATLAHECLKRADELAACTESPGILKRTFMSEPMQRVHTLVRGYMQNAGMQVRVDALGKKGEISGLMKTLGSMDPDARKEFGAKINVVKDEVTAAIAAQVDEAVSPAIPAALSFDAPTSSPPSAPIKSSIRVTADGRGSVASVCPAPGASIRRKLASAGLASQFSSFSSGATSGT